MTDIDLWVDSDQTPAYVISGAIRDRSAQKRWVDATLENVPLLVESVRVPRDPLEKMDRIMLHVAGNIKSANQWVKLPSTDYTVAFACDAMEFDYLLSELEELRDIEAFRPVDGPSGYRLSPNGWRRVIELRRTVPKTDQAFVAMWFSDETRIAWTDGFKPALESLGFAPFRIDLFEHNKKIDDEIIANIRRSGLVVADFTGNRGGVYFEAGFAMGLELPVIWTCREDHFGEVHFDTEHFNHIIWKDPADLNKRLINRILATIPGRTLRG